MPEQEKVEKEKKIYSPEEIHKMFNPSFLPTLQEFAQRIKKEMFPDEKIACFQAQLFLEFSDLEAPLTYESMPGKVHMQLQPVLQSEVDKLKAHDELPAQQNKGKDVGDAEV